MTRAISVKRLPGDSGLRLLGLAELRSTRFCLAAGAAVGGSSSLRSRLDRREEGGGSFTPFVVMSSKSTSVFFGLNLTVQLYTENYHFNFWTTN